MRRTRPSGRAAFSRGYVYNLTTSDVDTLQMFSQQVFQLISSPVRIFVAMLLLYMQLGASSIAALLLLICVMPFQVRVALVPVLCDLGRMLPPVWRFHSGNWFVGMFSG